MQADQAEAALRVAQAKAETRRAMAVAEEQEMTARTQEMKAKVVEAESEVPRAMAHAFKRVTWVLWIITEWKILNQTLQCVILLQILVRNQVLKKTPNNFSTV
ncbi:hypothetical protein Ct9H90mP29_22030 [bacterium]|nr:MAG: hypothetical protein Ct9H90mP29_22030 [bacterium]